MSDHLASSCTRETFICKAQQMSRAAKGCKRSVGRQAIGPCVNILQEPIDNETRKRRQQGVADNSNLPAKRLTAASIISTTNTHNKTSHS